MVVSSLFQKMNPQTAKQSDVVKFKAIKPRVDDQMMNFDDVVVTFRTRRRKLILNVLSARERRSLIVIVEVITITIIIIIID